jgi:membrane-associated phospholipid phosphatase
LSALLVRARHALFQFRPEEAVTLVYFLPMVYALTRMSLHFSEHGAALPPEGRWIVGRLIWLVVFMVAFVWLIRSKPHWRIVRDVLPFLFAGQIYTNLHDLIHFFNARDIEPWLYKIDVWMFGVEPTVWAQRFIHPALTDIFTFCYWLFYLHGPLLGLLLYVKGDRRAFRYTMVSVMICLYVGYFGYVAFPAVPPRYAIPQLYSTTLHGSPILDYTREAIAAVPLTSRGAFPSLHCAVTLLSLLLAFRFLRWFFWVQLPFATGLVLGTIYLRHHWAIDILVGFALAIVMYRAGPAFEDWWERMSRRYAGGVDWSHLKWTNAA